jgi:hypothetical protein
MKSLLSPVLHGLLLCTLACARRNASPGAQPEANPPVANTATPTVQIAPTGAHLPGPSGALKLSLSTLPKSSIASALPVEIALENQGDESVMIEHPASSLNVEFHLVDQRTHEDLSFTMGNTTTRRLRDAGEYAIEVPAHRTVALEPQGKLRFKVDASARLYLRPGDYDAFVTFGELASNHRKVSLRMTREAVHQLFTIARDPQANYSRREWAASQLVKLYPGFKLSLAAPDEPISIVRGNETMNEPLYVRFSKWWRVQLQSPDLDSRLEKLL